MTTATLNPEQSAALDNILDWLSSADPFFVLQGSAGTGKTFCIRELVNRGKGKFVFTAPTNKATKVLRESVTTKDYKPECRTIYSLLGLKLEANGEVKVLSAPEDPIDLSAYKAVIVDEGSMLTAQVLGFITHAHDDYGVKFLFMGDPAQLPPVGETHSPIWKIETGARLETVMRHDNQILELATRLRSVVDHLNPQIKLTSNNADEEGIWSVTAADMERAILRDAEEGLFSKPNASKAIAWRNVTVDKLNFIIRKQIFGAGVAQWLPEDRVLFMAPAKDLDDKPMASTDDEGKVERVEEDWHPFYSDIKIWRISIVLDDNRVVIARVLHPASQGIYSAKLEQLLADAKLQSRKWRLFWDFKEAFHGLRHAYAITAHRAQGSTYDTAFVDWRDILLNRNRQEAYRCLYVAVTRPKRKLILG